MPRSPDEISDATLRLALAPGVGPATVKRLATQFGSHEHIVDARASDLRQIDGIGAQTATALRRAIDDVDPAAARATIEKAGVRLILLGDDDYPPLLAAIPDPPFTLWIKGEVTAADRLAVAIVGSRKCTSYGREQAGRMGALLAECGLTIVSGGALGIDGEAHRAALRVGGRTIAVMGCGLEQSYPLEHAELFDRIVATGGALVSEYPVGTAPKATHFPSRNRIISGLSLGVVVVEAARRSGALITARQASTDQGREAMVVPGRVDSPASAGCLQAVRDGWATLVTNHAEVLDQLDASSQLVRGALAAAGHDDATTSATLFDQNLTEAQQKMVDVLTAADNAVAVEELAAQTQLPMSQVMAELTLLQIRGRIQKDHRGVRLRR